MVESESEVAHSCPTLCDSMDFIIYSPPGSSVRGIFQTSTGVRCGFLPTGIFSDQGSNLGLLHCRQTLLPSEPPGSP